MWWPGTELNRRRQPFQSLHNGRDRCTLIGNIQRDRAHVVAETLNQIGELMWIASGGNQLVVSCEDGLSWDTRP